MAIEKRFPKSPTDVLYTALSLLQKWSVLLKEDCERVNLVKGEVISWMESFNPSVLAASDVHEI